MPQPNQFTKARERGEPMPYRKPHKPDDTTKDKIRAEILSRPAYRYANANGAALEKYRMEPAQVQAAKVLIDRGKPTLQAVEMTQTDPLEQMTAEEQMEMARALIAANPGLIQALNLQFAPAAVQQSDHTTEVDTNLQVVESIKTA